MAYQRAVASLEIHNAARHAHSLLGDNYGRNEEEGSVHCLLDGDGDRNEADIAHLMAEEERDSHLQAGMVGKKREEVVGLVSVAAAEGVADLLEQDLVRNLCFLLVELHPRIFQSLVGFLEEEELEEWCLDEEERV